MADFHPTFCDIPGGQALIDWFGGVPRFHDAKLLDIRLVSKGTSTVHIHAWRTTDQVDDRGYFVLDKHVMVDFDLQEVTFVALTEFNLPGIIFDSRSPNQFPDLKLPGLAPTVFQALFGRNASALGFGPRNVTNLLTLNSLLSLANASVYRPRASALIPPLSAQVAMKALLQTPHI